MSILYQECIKRKNLPNCYHGRNHRQRSAASRLRNPNSCTYNFCPRTTFFEIHISVIYILYPTSPQKKRPKNSLHLKYNFSPRTTFFTVVKHLLKRDENNIRTYQSDGHVINKNMTGIITESAFVLTFD